MRRPDSRSFRTADSIRRLMPSRRVRVLCLRSQRRHHTGQLLNCSRPHQGQERRVSADGQDSRLSVLTPLPRPRDAVQLPARSNLRALGLHPLRVARAVLSADVLERALSLRKSGVRGETRLAASSDLTGKSPRERLACMPRRSLLLVPLFSLMLAAPAHSFKGPCGYNKVGDEYLTEIFRRHNISCHDAKRVFERFSDQKKGFCRAYQTSYGWTVRHRGGYAPHIRFTKGNKSFEVQAQGSCN